MSTSVYYSEYLQLDKILGAQDPESFKEGKEMAHDEMLFIIIHQSYELWFKQILFEVESVIEILSKPSINDNSPDLQLVVHRLQRSVTILQVLVQQIDIIETMTPLDFLDFRDMLRPASGFQSWQFKLLESKLGLEYEQRHGQDYYVSQLKQHDIDTIKRGEEGPTVLAIVNNWLERMPFAEDAPFWANEDETFWTHYKKLYAENLADVEKANLEFFNDVFEDTAQDGNRKLSPKACRSALFIMLYRGFPVLELPFQLLQTLLEIDNQLSNWRFRHINMVKRMIGTRIGTGGSTGAGYLQNAMEKHYIFREISQLTSFMIDRRKLPVLPEPLKEKLGYNL